MRLIIYVQNQSHAFSLGLTFINLLFLIFFSAVSMRVEIPENYSFCCYTEYSTTSQKKDEVFKFKAKKQTVFRINNRI